MDDVIWQIALQYGAGWFSRSLGYMELFYPNLDAKLAAEDHFRKVGFAILQGTKYWSEHELNVRSHRVFSTI